MTRPRVSAVLMTRLVIALLLALGVGLRLPALRVERIADDWYQLSMVEGTYPVRRAPWDLYDFIRANPPERAALLDRGTFPWWTAPDLHIAAWRPLASLTLSLDHVLFGRGTVGPHAHSLLWLVGFLLAASWWLRAVLPERAALLALGLLCVDESLTVPTAWLANRPSLMSGVFGLLAMGVMARRDASPSWRGDRIVAALALASLLSGEYGVAFMGCAVACEVFMGRGDPRERLRACLAVVLPAVAWVIVWRALGHGVSGTMTYLDPIGRTGEWLTTALLRLPTLLGELCLTAPVELNASSAPAFVRAALGLFVVALIALAALARGDVARRRVALGLSAGALAALVPVLSAPPMGRLLLAAAPAFSAALVALGLCAWTPPGRGGRAVAWAVRGAVALLLALHLVAPVIHVRGQLRGTSWWKASDVVFRSLPGVNTCRAHDQDHVLVAAGSFGVLHVLPLLWQGRGCERPRSWRVLSVPASEVVLVRTGEREVTVWGRGGALFTPVAQLWHPRPFQAGDWVARDTFTADVMAVEGGLPSRVRYTFDRALDDPRVVLWVSVHGGYEQIRALPLRGGRVVARPFAVPE